MSGIDEKGARPFLGNACVLLSGGMDSTVCLFWALAKFQSVRAVAFDYGQPHRDAELVAAGSLARRHSVPFERVVLADTFASGLLTGVPVHERMPTTAIHRAFVPGRNLVFLSLALARACLWWPDPGAAGACEWCGKTLGEHLDKRDSPLRTPCGGLKSGFVAGMAPAPSAGDITLVMGCTKEDTAGFPDCTEAFLKAADGALSAAVARKVHVAAPYVKSTKTEMLTDASMRFGSSLAEVQASWSCYEGKGPCGKCTACVLRAQAFAAVGLMDLCATPTITGGDVHRDLRLLEGT